MACQIPRRILTPCGELHSHVQPPQVKQRTSVPTQISFVEGTVMCFRPPVSRRLRLISLTGIADMLSPAIGSFRSAARLGGLGALAQSYVGKRAVSKGIAGAYGGLWVAFRAPLIASESVQATRIWAAAAGWQRMMRNTGRRIQPRSFPSAGSHDPRCKRLAN